jgi:FkbM family methyltransferase
VVCNRRPDVKVQAFGRQEIVELYYNLDAAFTRWVVKDRHLQEPFVLLEVGVQGGEHRRWEQLGDLLVLHGFDAIEEAVARLKQESTAEANRYYHWIAAGAADEERFFYFNPSNPTQSSMYPRGKSRFDVTPVQQARTVPVRRLDTLFEESLIPQADFLKVDVEGFEKDVLLGARQLLAAGVLGVEIESNFGISPTYPRGHFATLHDMLLEHHLLVFDIGFNRIPRASFQRALARAGRRPVSRTDRVGKPATLDVLFCRDPIDEIDHPENYLASCRPLSLDQLIKMTVIYELHGLNDIAIDMVERFADRLSARLDVNRAIRLLADPHCRPGRLRKQFRNVVRSVRRRMGRGSA